MDSRGHRSSDADHWRGCEVDDLVQRAPEQDPIGVGVIGYGYWGPNLVRNFSEIPGARVVGVADLSRQRLASVRTRHPSVRTFEDVDEMLDDPEIDAVCVATPVRTHHQLGMSALQAGKHVLMEKPITATSDEARSLIAEATRRNRVLMVDHTFLYAGAVRKIVEQVRSGALGDICYYDSVRVNLGLFQSDVNVLWDLAVHDLAIIDALLPHPVAVAASGVSHVPGQPENIAYVTLLFPGTQIGHLHVNWLAPVKVRRTLIGCKDRMLVYDDLEPSEKIKIYDCGADLGQDSETVHKLLVSYRKGDMWAPQLDSTEALRTEALHFLDCIRTGARPLTDGYAGLRMVQILEAADRSMRDRGTLVEIPAMEER